MGKKINLRAEKSGQIYIIEVARCQVKERCGHLQKACETGEINRPRNDGKS